MTHWNAKQIYLLAKEMSKVALDEQRKMVVSVKPDNSVVTQVDKMLELMVISALSNPDKGVHVLGEETIQSFSQVDLEKALQETCYVVDPIDGTAPYSSMQPLWGCSIGYTENGKALEGCIVLPALNEILITDGNVVLYGKGVHGFPEFDRLVVIASNTKQGCSEPSRMLGINQSLLKKLDLSKNNDFYGAYFNAVYPLFYLVLGRMKAVFLHLHVWDFVAATAMMQKLGFHICFDDGTEISDDIIEDYDLSKTKQGHFLSKHAILFSPDKATSIEFLSSVGKC